MAMSWWWMAGGFPGDGNGSRVSEPISWAEPAADAA